MNYSLTSSYIFLHNTHFYSFHGIGQQERNVGNDFRIDIRLKYNALKACSTDNITYALNYASVYQILKEEMNIPSNLLEHVCNRIIEHLFRQFPIIEEIHIILAKRNPPMRADIDEAGIEMNCKRKL